MSQSACKTSCHKGHRTTPAPLDTSAERSLQKQRCDATQAALYIKHKMRCFSKFVAARPPNFLPQRQRHNTIDAGYWRRANLQQQCCDASQAPHTHTHQSFKFNDVRKDIKQSACQTSATKASAQHQQCWKLLHNQAIKATLRCHKGNAHTRDPHVMMPEVCRNQPAKLPAT